MKRETTTLCNSRAKVISSFAAALPFLLMLSSCSAVIALGEKQKAPLPYLSHIAAFSLVWLIPAGILWFITASDRPEIKAEFGITSKGDLVFTPTGRTIPGNPETAGWVASAWLLGYPILFFYFTNAKPLITMITGYPNIDSILTSFVIPLLILAISLVLIAATALVPKLLEGLVIVYFTIIFLSAVNLVIWLLCLGVHWLIASILGIFNWLLAR